MLAVVPDATITAAQWSKGIGSPKGDQGVHMAHFQIHREVGHSPDGDGGWQICFQFGTYWYDANEGDDPTRDEGYRFIWRRPNGQLQGARGQARLTPEYITILLGRAAEAGWYPEPPAIAV